MASNSQVELNAIKKLMTDKTPELLVSISPDYFGNGELKKIFMLIRKFYMENSEFPGWATLSQYIGGLCKTADKAKFMMALMKQIEERDISGLSDDLLLKELRDFQKFRLVLSKAGDLVQAVEDKDIDKTLGRLKELHDDVFLNSSKECLDLADMSSRAGQKITFNFLSTGIEPIDKRGGLIEGGYTIIAGAAKAGKSALAGQIAMHQYLHENASVAYFSLEMQYEELRARLMSNHASIDVGTLMDDNLSPEERTQLRKCEADFYCIGTEDLQVDLNLTTDQFFEHVFATYPRRENKFYIFDDRLDWDEFWIRAELLATTKGVKVFVLDYPFLCNRGASNKDLAQWEYALLQSKNLKTFAHKHKCCVITPAQLDQGKKGEDPKLRFVTNQITNCDLCLYLINGDDDKTLGTITVRFGAYRNFRTIKDQPVLKDFKLEKQLQYSRFAYTDF